jgi:hypothetical protein
MTLPSDTIDATEIYNNGLFAPANPPQSAEALNGALEQDNYSGGNGSIQPYMLDLGTFARGYSSSFSRREFVYARQLDDNQTRSIVSCGLAFQVFLPFTARVINFGFQCWFNHDASRYKVTGEDAANRDDREFWTYALRVFPRRVQRAEYEQSRKSMTGRLPYGRQQNNGTFLESDGVHEEARWYYVHKTSMINGPFTRGYYDLELVINVQLKKPSTDPFVRTDEFISKCKLMSGNIWMLALR